MRQLCICIVIAAMLVSCRSTRNMTDEQRHAESVVMDDIRAETSATCHTAIQMQGRYHMIWYDTSAPAGEDGRPPIAAEVYADETAQVTDSTTETKAETGEHTEIVAEDDQLHSEKEKEDTGNSARWKTLEVAAIIALMLLVCWIAKKSGIAGLIQRLTKKAERLKK